MKMPPLGIAAEILCLPPVKILALRQAQDKLQARPEGERPKKKMPQPFG